MLKLKNCLLLIEILGKDLRVNYEGKEVILQMKMSSNIIVEVDIKSVLVTMSFFHRSWQFLKTIHLRRFNELKKVVLNSYQWRKLLKRENRFCGIESAAKCLKLTLYVGVCSQI